MNTNKHIYMQAHTQQHFDYAIKYLKQLGYNWVNDSKEKVTFKEVKSWFNHNAKPYLHGYYNSITNKLEIQATTKTIEATHGIRL